MDWVISIVMLLVGVLIGWVMAKSDGPGDDSIRSEAMKNMCQAMLREQNVPGYKMDDEYKAVLDKVLGD